MSGADHIENFAQAVRTTSEVPDWARKNIGSVHNLEQRTLDQSYLDFLDEQIALCPRGEEWNRVLQKRRIALAEYCGKIVTSGIVSQGEKNCFIKIDPEAKKVLYWEVWDLDH